LQNTAVEVLTTVLEEPENIDSWEEEVWFITTIHVIYGNDYNFRKSA